MANVDKTDPKTMSAAGCLYHLTHDWNRGGIEITGERWPEAEPIIKTDPRAAYVYAFRIINKGQNLGIRWPEAEPYIMKDPELAYDYAKQIINRGKKLGIRWPEAEPYIMKDKKWAAKYNKRIIRHQSRDLLLCPSLLQNIGSETSSRGKMMRFNVTAENAERLRPDEVKAILENLIETAHTHFEDVLDSDSDHDPEWKEYARNSLDIKFTIEIASHQGENQ